jgi:acetyl esterase/lipase
MKILVIFLFAFLLYSCSKKGCTDVNALNYDSNAQKNDGSCEYDDFSSSNVSRVNYGADERQHFDLYLPSGHNDQTKVVLLVHGGAWVLGPGANDSVTTFNGGIGWDIVSPLISDGYAVAIMKYRLACYTSQPAALSNDPYFFMSNMIEDIDLAISKISDIAPGVDISANEVALIGESAGAHISLLYSLRNTSSASLKTVISFYSPALLDETNFKSAISSFPYNNIPLNSDVGMPKYANSCNFTTSGSVNLFWGLKSLVGANLDVSTTIPSFTDTLSPAYSGNIQRNLPTFILHGSSDDLVPAAHADSLIEQITSSFGTIEAADGDFSGQHKMLKYDNCGHGWGGGSCNRNQMINDVRSWLSNHF